MTQQGVFKTTVTCSLGISVETPTKDWMKSNVSVSSEVGPGYPDAELMGVVLRQQMSDAERGCEEYIESLANKILQKVQAGAL